MAHKLNFEDGQASLMYVGRVPWHGLGTQLQTAPATAEAAIKAAHLDWEVGLKPVLTGEKGMFYGIPEKQAIVRLDKWGQEDCPVFGLVGADYKPLQNRDTFTFFDPIVASGTVAYETAGALGRGERVWVLAKVKGKDSEFAVKGSDIVQKYLLLSNGHDGKTAVQIRFTPVRVVCQNTLSFALDKGSDLFKIYHVPQMHLRLGEAQERIQGILRQYDEIEKLFRQLAEFQMNKQTLDQYVLKVIPDPARRKNQTDHSYSQAVSKVSKLRELSKDLFESGAGNSERSIKGTLWAAYNGVTEMVDHRLHYATPWQRMNSICFGEGERMKQDALYHARTMLSAK